MFEGKCYRIGGDEFAVVDEISEKEEFYSAVSAVSEKIKEQGISCSIGISWCSGPCNFKAQLEIADREMYQNKKDFYGSYWNRQQAYYNIMD